MIEERSALTCDYFLLAAGSLGQDGGEEGEEEQHGGQPGSLHPSGGVVECVTLHSWPALVEQMISFKIMSFTSPSPLCSEINKSGPGLSVKPINDGTLRLILRDCNPLICTENT